MMNKAVLILFSILLLTCSQLVGCTFFQSTTTIPPTIEEITNTSNTSQFETAVVVRVVDGDTLIINRGLGDERLRLIGMDTPESVNQDENRNIPEGEIVSNYTKSLVSKGMTLYLQKDISDTDKYGRLLRYVWLEIPSDLRDPLEVSTKMLNGILVYQGYADVHPYKPDTSYTDMFYSFLDDAQKENRGVSYLWN